MAVRGLKWILTARDATGPAFRSFGTRLKKAGSAIVSFKTKLLGLGAAVGAALGGRALKTFADIERTARGFGEGTDADIKKVDGLRQAMEIAGGSADELLGGLEQVQANLDAAISDEQMRRWLGMFDVSPDMSAIDATIKLMDALGSAKVEGNLDLMRRVLGPEMSRRGLQAFGGASGGASQFISTARTVDPRVARENERTDREVAAATANIERHLGTFFNAFDPVVRYVARVLAGRENPQGEFAESIRNQPGFNTDLTLMERYLRMIAEEAKKDKNILGQ